MRRDRLPFDDLNDPLRRFSIFRTSDPEVFRASLLSVHGASVVDVQDPKKLRAFANRVQLEDITLGLPAVAGCSSWIVLQFPRDGVCEVSDCGDRKGVDDDRWDHH